MTEPRPLPRLDPDLVAQLLPREIETIAEFVRCGARPEIAAKLARGLIAERQGRTRKRRPWTDPVHSFGALFYGGKP